LLKYSQNTTGVYFFLPHPVDWPNNNPTPTERDLPQHIPHGHTAARFS